MVRSEEIPFENNYRGLDLIPWGPLPHLHISLFSGKRVDLHMDHATTNLASL